MKIIELNEIIKCDDNFFRIEKQKLPKDRLNREITRYFLKKLIGKDKVELFNYITKMTNQELNREGEK